MRHSALIIAAIVACAFGLSLNACSENDANLETPEYAKSMISIDGPAIARMAGANRFEVEGKATNHDKFQHDVFFTATLWDAGGRAVGTATGKLEDWPAGHSGIYKLVGSGTPGSWARVSVVVSNVTEHVRGRPE